MAERWREHSVVTVLLAVPVLHGSWSEIGRMKWSSELRHGHFVLISRGLSYALWASSAPFMY